MKRLKLTEQDILQFLMQTRPRLTAAAWIVVRDTHAAEDIFQNVTLKAMTGRASFESEGALLSWAMITARREGLDWLRRRQRESIGLDEGILDLLDHEWKSEGPVSSARLDALSECLDALPEAARHLLLLRYGEGRTCLDVAAQIGMGVDAVYQRLSRLHRTLQRCVEGKLARTGAPPA